MKNTIYYGEYTLRRWVELILSGNVVLPGYQRCFKLNKESLLTLIESMRNEEFVPPVTIAANKDNTGKNLSNLILDGQQRLTAIILWYLGVMPNDKKFQKWVTASEGDNEASNDASLDMDKTMIMKWDFNDILEICKEKNCVGDASKLSCELLLCDKYIHVEEFKEKSDSIFDERYLGFSYIVPNITDPHEIQKGYCKLFRHINYYTTQLLPMESRRSLYYMDAAKKDYFDGKDGEHNVLCDLKMMVNYKPVDIDFIRYLSMLSEYQSLNRSARRENINILAGFSSVSSRETYYANYVSHVLKLPVRTKNNFAKFDFDKVFPDDNWKLRYSVLRETVALLKSRMFIDRKFEIYGFSSWIDADIWLFGLIYHIVFLGKKLANDIDALHQDISLYIRKIKGGDEYFLKDGSHPSRNKKHEQMTIYKKSPNRITYIRDRISKSIKIYSKHVQ